jgi:hypothetical protein
MSVNRVALRALAEQMKTDGHYPDGYEFERTREWEHRVKYIAAVNPQSLLALLDECAAWEEQSNRNLQRCEELADELRKARK